MDFSEFTPPKKASLLKVPKITLYFWVAKLLTTAMGEATSDYLVFHTNPYLAVMGCGLLFLAAIWLQIWSRQYSAHYYWFAVIMVSIFGTQIADVTHVVLGVPYVISTSVFFVALATILGAWKFKEKTLSIHSVHTPRREAFYWATIVATFALGTAAGDMTASSLDLGYFASGLLFIVLFCIPVVAYFIFDLNEIAAFWIAYILTRPLGASFADWTDKPMLLGGLGFGDGPVSISLTLVIMTLLLFLIISKVDDPNRRALESN
ncbi:COG4705 family protein [Acidithiobacillus sp.]